MANLTYVIGDLHGYNSLLTGALDAISNDMEAFGDGDTGRRTIVLLGDYVDRGPESADLIAQVRKMEFELPDMGIRVVPLRGNHEDLMLVGGYAFIEQLRQKVQTTSAEEWQSLRDERGMAPFTADMDVPDLAMWSNNGGVETLNSYFTVVDDTDGRRVMKTDAILRLADDLEWMGGLRHAFTDNHRVYVHASVKDGVPLNEQSEASLLWARYGKLDNVGYGDKHVVHGHTPFKDGPILLEKRTNLDVGSFLWGRIAVGVFDDDQAGGPVRMLCVGGTDEWRRGEGWAERRQPLGEATA